MERTDLYAMAAQLRRLSVNRGRMPHLTDIIKQIEQLASDLQRDEHDREQSRDEQEHTDRVRRMGGDE